jgi:hypothetical protein
MIKTPSPVNTWSVVSHPSKVSYDQKASPKELGIALGILFTFTLLGILFLKIISKILK